MTARHVLFVPIGGTRAQLLAHELYGGARPGVAWREIEGPGPWQLDYPTIDAAGPLDLGIPDPPSEAALILRWEGERSLLGRARLLDVLTRGRPEGQAPKGADVPRGPNTHRIPDFYWCEGKWRLELPENPHSYAHTFGEWVVDTTDSDLALAFVAALHGLGAAVEVM